MKMTRAKKRTMAITISVIIKGSSLLFEALNEIGAHKCFLPEDRLKVKMIQTQKFSSSTRAQTLEHNDNE